jgi:hypothetical protein
MESPLARRFGALTGWRPALAGTVGFASAASSAWADFAFVPLKRASTFGTGYTRETDPRPL